MNPPRAQKRNVLIFFKVALFLFALAPCSALSAGSCTDRIHNCDPSIDYFTTKVVLKYASTVKLKYNNTYVDVIVSDVSGTAHIHRLVRCGCPIPESPNGAQVIQVPPTRLFVNDGPTLAFLTHSIPQIDRIVAVGDPKYVYSQSIREKFTEGVNNSELSKRTDIDVSFINLNSVSFYKQENISIPYFANGESDEVNPFGRSEWVKIIGLMFNAVESANSKFADILNKYEKMKQIALNARRRPSVLLNYPYGKTWSLPSQNQYITQILRDANVDYRFMNDGQSDTHTLSLSEISGNFSSARFLLLSGPFPPLTQPDLRDFFQIELNEDGSINEDGVAVNKALRTLASVRCANVWVTSKRVSEDLNANDYFEFGATRPDLILEDIVHAVHPYAEFDNGTTFSFKMDDASEEIKRGKCPYNNLMNEAPSGMIYVDIELSINGMDRFEVEDKLFEHVIPEVAIDERIHPDSIEFFFEKPAQKEKTVLVLRIMVNETDEKSIINDSEKIKDSVQRVLGSDFPVQMLKSEPSSGNIEIVRGGIGKGALVGIVLSSILAVILIGLLLFHFGTKRGRNSGATEMRDRFWREHGVRLADDTEVRDRTAAGFS